MRRNTDMAIKLGVSGWAISGVYDPPFEEGLEQLGKLGFQGTELIVSSRNMMDEYFTEERCDKLRRQLDSYGMEVSEFVVYKDLLVGMSLLDKEKKEEAYRIFERGAQITKALGCGIINTVSHWIPGLQAPVPYPPSYVYPNVPGVNLFEPKMVMTYPEFDWDELWDNYVDSVRTVCDIADQYGLKFALEGHPHVIVSHVDSFIRLYKEVGRKNLGMNYDTSMQGDQREYQPISLRKLGKKRLLHMHVRDSDSVACHQLPIGCGVYDWDGIITELKKMDFDGYLSLEYAKYADPIRWLTFSKRYLEEVIDRIYQ